MASTSYDYLFDYESELDPNKLQTIYTFNDGWEGPTPLVFQRVPPEERRIDLFVIIHKLFVKRRPIHSRFVIKLILDYIFQNQLTIAWDILREQNLNLGVTWPYITLITCPFGNQLKLEKIIKTLAKKQDIFPVSFLSILPGEDYLCLSLLQSDPLIQFHSELCEKITGAGIEIDECFRTGTWIPFCTVADSIPGNRIGDAVTALESLPCPLVGVAINICLAEYTNPRKTTCNDEGATLLFEKEITYVDAMLCRFSVPKEHAENDMFFPWLDCRESVAIEVWDPEGRKREMMLRRYMKYTYQITADWKLPEMRMNLVAGNVIRFFKLRRESVLDFPYEYMVQLN